MAADLAAADQKMIGADKNYDARVLVAELHRIGVKPHVAQNTARPAAQRSMAVPPGTGGMTNRSMPAVESRKCLAGSWLSEACASSSFATPKTWAPCLACT